MNKQQRFETILKVLFAGMVCFLIAPIIQTVIAGMLGLIVAVVIGAAALFFAPVVIHQIGVWKYKSIRAMVSRDPINNLIKSLADRHQRIEKGRVSLEKQRTALAKYKRNCEQMIQKYPAKKDDFLQRQKMFEDMFAYRVDAYAKARQDYTLAQEQLDYLEMEYGNAVAAIVAGQAFEGSEDFMTKLIESTAISAVGEQVDRSLAQMEMAMIDAKVEKQIEGRGQHAVSYSASGEVLLGNILEPLKVRA